MSKARRRVRCPYCHGLHTKRHGYFLVNQGSKSRRRYYCYDCQRTFTLWTHQLTEEAVKLYFDTQASYRAVGRNLKIEPKAGLQENHPHGL